MIPTAAPAAPVMQRTSSRARWRWPIRRAAVLALSAVALAALYLVVRVTGGQPNTLVHLAYLPIIAVAATAGWRGGALTGLAAGVLFGPSTTTSSAPSALILGEFSWLIRLGAYVAVGTISGVLWGRSARLLHEVRTAEERLRAVVGRAPIVLWTLDRDGRFTLSEGRALETLGLRPGEVVGRSVFDLYADQPAILGHSRRALAGAAFGATVETGGRVFESSYAPLVDATGRPTGTIGVAMDVTERARAEAERARLAVVVEQAAESIMITDPDGTVRYVNPAWERLTGFTSAEVLGQTPRVLAGATDDRGPYRSMWATVSHGEVWSGTLTVRRMDGTLVHSETLVEPIRDEAGRVTSLVSIGRDVTLERDLSSRLQREIRERAEVAARLAALRPGEAPEATADAICAEAATLPGFDFVGLIHFTAGGLLVPMALRVPVMAPLAVGRPLPRARAAYLRERASAGPWVEEFRARPEDRDYGHEMAAAGLRAVAYAPIHGPTRLIGVFCLGTTSPELAARITDHFTTVREFAAIAGALLGPAHEQRHQEATVRKRIESVIRREAFEAVFQPVVELATGRVVGYETLTRFADGTPPAERFAKAEAVGLGSALELACLRRALATARSLPGAVWVSFNVSPGLLLDDGDLATVLADEEIRRPTILEVTEHAAVADYAALRAAASALGPRVSLAVDDAGAGYAGLRHIVELRPSIVKLDLALVRSIEADPARQALVAGVQHFAAKTGVHLIAEGIETEAEVATLQGLGIELGQGYLFGRPGPITAYA